MKRSLFTGFVQIFEVAFDHGACFILTGDIIGDGDHRRAPFLVLGLSLCHGTIFLFLEQIGSSPAAHARTCCVDPRRCSAGEMASEIPEITYVCVCWNLA